MADFNRQPTIFPNGIDLKKQEAKNLVLQNINARTFDASYLYKSETIKVPGLIIFDPEDKHAKIWVDKSWKPLAFLGEGGGLLDDLTLNDITDVNIDNVKDKDILVWDAEKGEWINVNQSTIKPDLKNYLDKESLEKQSILGEVEFKNNIIINSSGNTGLKIVDSKDPTKGASISWDQKNNSLKIDGNIYATGSISAGGSISGESSEGTGVDTLGGLINVEDSADLLNNTGNIQIITKAPNESKWEPTFLNYIHQQDISSDTWVIQHNLHRYPTVTVIDSAGTVISGEIIYDSIDQVTLKFSCSFGGTAELK